LLSARPQDAPLFETCPRDLLAQVSRGQAARLKGRPSSKLRETEPLPADEADAVLLPRSDSFTKREKANEDYAIRQREKEK